MIIRNEKYRKTFDGVVSTIYNSMKQHSKARGHIEPEFTLQELNTYLQKNETFSVLFKEWEESGYDRWMKPSCDRDDNSKNYRFDNITVMRWKNNSDLGRDESNRKRMKGVVKMDMLENVLEEYESLAEACRENNITSRSNLRNHINNNTKHCVGYKWRFN